MKASGRLVLVLVLVLVLAIPVSAALDDGYTDHLLHLNDVSLTDESGSVWTNHGSSISTTCKLGTGSLYSASSSEYIFSTSSMSSYNHSTSDFTIDAWIYHTGSTPYVLSVYANATNSEGFYVPSGLRYFFMSGGTYRADYLTPSVLPINQWTHVAFVRSGANAKIYYNGVSQPVTITTAFNGNLDMSGAGVPNARLGMGGTTGTWFDEIRLSHTARWTSDFNPEIVEYGASGGIPGMSNIVVQVNATPGNLPIDGAYVLLDGSAQGLPMYQGFTDANGTYSIAVVNGLYQIGVGAMNYVSQDRSLNIVNGQTINFYLVSGNFWPPTTAPPAGYQEVDFYVHNENTGMTIPAHVIVYKNGVHDVSGYVQTYSGYIGFYLDQNTTYRAQISLDGYYDYYITSFTTWTNTTPMEFFVGLYPSYIYNSTTPTPIPTSTSSYNMTLISTLSPGQRASKLGAATDVWYLNVDFLSSLAFICVVMGFLGLMGKGMGGGGGRRRR